MKNLEKELFYLCKYFGEKMLNNIHIVESSTYNCSPPDYLKEFRIYHSAGHCLDISKQAIINDETGKFEGYEYNVYQQWDGFTEIPLQDIINDLNYQKQLNK